MLQSTKLELIKPLTSAPKRTILLLDVDGTLAPITAHPEDTTVPEGTRRLIADLARSYMVVACVSGRRAAEAKRIVAVGSLWYIGGHGSEQLAPGGTEVEVNSEFEQWNGHVRSFTTEVFANQLKKLKIRAEDKGPVIAFHWRSSPNHERSEEALRNVAEQAQERGLFTHWGRKVLEIRPPIKTDKGAGIARLIERYQPDFVLYAGDDRTDLDAFLRLDQLVQDGKLQATVKLAVTSDESPQELLSAADLTVAGPTKLLPVLRQLLAETEGP